jgi:predicted  nucleic acid-binding Zn-ribbon protein
MSKVTVAIEIVLVSGILTTTPAAHAPVLELGSCQDDLDQVRRMASDASNAAEEAKSKFEEVEDCRENREVYDVAGDGCRSRRNDYESAVSDLESKMDDLDSHLRSVQTSCAYDFTINRLSDAEAAKRHMEAAQRRLGATQNRLCASIRDLVRSGLTPNDVLKMCKANLDEQTCKACLGSK